MKDIDISENSALSRRLAASLHALTHHTDLSAAEHRVLCQNLKDAISALTDREAKLAEAEDRLHKCDGMAREINTLTDEVRDLQSQLAAAEARGLERAAQACDPGSNHKCSCIKQFDSGSYYQTCDCQNSGDLASAEWWCASMNLMADIRALITSPMPQAKPDRLDNGCDHDFRWHPDAGDICARCGIENDPIPTASPMPSQRERELADLVRAARAKYDAMTPEQKAAHDKAQRESFVRGMMPTGDPRFD